MILSLRNWCANNIFVVRKAYNYEDLVGGSADCGNHAVYLQLMKFDNRALSCGIRA